MVFDSPWIPALSGLALSTALLVLTRIAFKGAELRQARHCQLVCPRTSADADCWMIQDIRTGQWKGVRVCSALAESGLPSCEEECRKSMNLGLLQPSERLHEPSALAEA